jgi:cobalt-zinc-cadmium efflux system membrane fusion protein
MKTHRVLLGASMLVLAALAFAHGDEDHSDTPAKPASPTAAATSVETIGSPIYIPKESQFLFGVHTVLAKTTELRGQVRVLGKVIPRSGGEAELFSPIAGVVLAPSKAKFPLPSDTVKKGDILAVIEGSLSATDQVGLASNRAEANARVAVAEARVSAAQKNLKRVESLTGVVSERDVQSARTEVEIAQAELSGAKKAAGIAGGSGGANRFEIRSPIDGVVAEVGATVGGIIGTDKPLFRIIDFSTLWVEAQIFEDDLPKVQGASDAVIFPEGLGDSQFSARLISLGRVINEQSRTVPALFEVANPEGVLRVGMFARVGIIAGQNLSAITVPKDAIIDQVGRKIVYVHTLPEFFEARAVTLGPDDGSNASILSGIKDSERIVTDGLPTVRVAAGGK